MFTQSGDAMLRVIDELAGDREGTCQVLALASATVLTASSHGMQRRWLCEVERRIQSGPPRSQVIVSSRFRQKQGLGLVHGEGDYGRAVQMLLDSLDEECQGQVGSILSHLSHLSVLALSSLSQAQRKRWADLVDQTHRRVQSGYLHNHPELN